MPKTVGALLSFRASGLVGGHRRGRRRPDPIVAFLHPLLAGSILGSIPLGFIGPQVPYSGTPFVSTTFAARLTVAPAVGFVHCFLTQNGVLRASFVIFGGQQYVTFPFAMLVDHDDFFQILCVTTDPIAQDLLWIVVGPAP